MKVKSWFSKALLYYAAMLVILVNINPAVASSNATQQSWKFRVLLDDKPIGFHQVTVARESDRKTIHTQADFDVRFMYIPVYSYNHETREIWEDGCLVNIASTTDDNGDGYFINSQKQQQAFILQTQDGKQTLNGCVRSFAYWDINLLKSNKLLNTQTGAYQPVTITDLGNDTLKLEQKDIDARHFRLVCEDMTIDLWYTQDMQWLALESTTKSGAVLRYLPESINTLNREASL
mgnify:FL=1